MTRKQEGALVRQVFEEESVMNVLMGSMASPIVGRAGVTRPVHTAVVGFVILTAVSAPADTVSVEDNAISARLATMVFLTVSGADVIR